MYCVHEKPGLTLSQVGLVMNLEKSTVSRMIQKLVDYGYVLESRNGRSLSLTLSDSGEELLLKVNACWRNVNERFTEMIGEEEAENLQKSISFAAKKCR
jgi:DNA-binding MarR family transcriptional regulator